MANIYDHVSITINIKSDYSSDIISFTCVQCLLKKKGFMKKPGAEHKTTWHVKNASGIKRMFSMHLSNVQTQRSNMHTDKNPKGQSEARP